MNQTDPDVTPRILAVVVTSNGKKWLSDCLQSVAAQLFRSDVIVIDNASASSAEEVTRRILPDAEFVRLNRNLGFGAAANHALEVSEHAPSADYYLFLHDDVILEPEVTSLLLATGLETDAGVVGGKGLDMDSPEILLEVGLTADQFGYPFAGLEEGEIDQGQHDSRRETLYVSNACILVSRQCAERIGLWDGAYFAFGEDLDLCTRARLAGLRVLVQPGAEFRHAEALTRGKRDVPAADKIRYFTRRNRLRTMAKNSAAYRMPALITIYALLSLAEMLLLTIFRRFDELSAYPKAFSSFFFAIPDIAKRRRAIQKRRAIPDRRLRRLMVGDIHRMRVFLERKLQDWQRGSLSLGTRAISRFAPSALKSTLTSWLRKPGTLPLLAVLFLMVFAARRSFFGGAIASGSLWPFPDDSGRLIREYFTAWRGVRLGTESATPVAFPLMWVFSVFAGGDPVFSQRLMVGFFTFAGLFGMNRFVKKRTSSATPRVMAVAVYALGPATRLFVTTGDLAALVLYGTFPFVLDIALRILGRNSTAEGDVVPVAPTPEAMTKDLARLSILMAITIALAPSSLLAFCFAWLLVSFHSLWRAWDRGDVSRRAGWLLASVPTSLLLLAPWSFEALRPRGAILGPLFSGAAGTFQPLWEGLDFSSFISVAPDVGTLAALVVPVLGLSCLALTSPSRRREARLMATLWLFFAVIGGLVSTFGVSAPVASPALWLIIPLASISVMAGHLVAGVAEELPRHSLGWRHFAVGVVALSLATGLLGGWFLQLASWERPRDAFAGGSGKLAKSISSYLETTAQDVGDFRVLWVGKRWVDPVRGGMRRMDRVQYFLTGPQGLNVLESQESPPSQGDFKLEETVDAMVGKRLHLAGHLLAPASVRFIIVDPNDEDLMSALRRQRDIALEQQLGNIAIFANLQWLPRAVLAPVNLVTPVTAKAANDRDLILVEWAGGRSIPGRTNTSFVGELPRTRHSQLLLAQNFNTAWRARVGEQRLEHAEAFGWSNRFELPASAKGEVRITFGRRWIRVLWLAAQLLLILTAAAAATGIRSEVRGWLR